MEAGGAITVGAGVADSATMILATLDLALVAIGRIAIAKIAWIALLQEMTSWEQASSLRI